MYGYHGTTEKNANDIISTKTINVNEFKIDGNFTIPQNQRIPNDLGNGLYFYYHDESEPCYDALKNAKRYVQEFKPGTGKKAIIKVVVNDTEENEYLDFNDLKEQRLFIKFREKLFEKINYNYKASKVKNDGASRRNNIDGIFLEAMLKYVYKDRKIDLILKDSYTPFYNGDRQISNFPNGREVCLKNLDLINWSETEVVEL